MQGQAHPDPDQTPAFPLKVIFYISAMVKDSRTVEDQIYFFFFYINFTATGLRIRVLTVGDPDPGEPYEWRSFLIRAASEHFWLQQDVVSLEHALLLRDKRESGEQFTHLYICSVYFREENL
jgi:hypothetical protein